MAIGLGLYSEPGADPGLELEAGGRVAANLMVYWPFLLVISPVLILTGMFGLLPYRFAPGGAIVGGVVASLFAQWVGTELYVSDYKPAGPDTSTSASARHASLLPRRSQQLSCIVVLTAPVGRMRPRCEAEQWSGWSVGQVHHAGGIGR